MSYYDKSKTEQVHTTLAKQLALYVTDVFAITNGS
jgi:hypothetical protein